MSSRPISDFHRTLADFNTSVSVITPADWINASTQHVLGTLQLVGVSGEEYARFAQAPLIYPRLLVYALRMSSFVQAIPGASERKSKSARPFKPSLASRIMGVLQAELSKWNEYDEFTQLLNHNSISHTLWDFLGQCRENSHSCNARAHAEKLLNLDVTGIAAHILLILHDSRRRKLFLTQRESQAQALLDLLQKLLDFVSLDPRLRPPIMSAIIKLSKHSGLYPECLTIRGVQKLGQDPVAGGSFGDIWKGEVGGHTIALKVMRIFGTSDVEKVLKASSYEAVLWRQLSHPNLLPFYGLYHWNDERSRICLISPWMSNGNVLQYLERSPQVDRVSLLSDVAVGLKYLHSCKPSVVHGDLKGANIMITPSLQACITDFGLAIFVNDSKFPLTSSSSMASRGTLRWQAPELLNSEGDTNSLASDIYAFACVCYEIFVGHPPFYELKNEYRVISAVVQGNRPRRPSLDLYTARGLDDAIWALINKCWGMNPTQRPSAHDVVQSLLSRSTPSGNSPPTCDWDEAMTSRLRSTLTGHRWSGPIHPLEVAQGLDDWSTFKTEPPPSSPTPRAPSRLPDKDYSELEASVRESIRDITRQSVALTAMTGTTFTTSSSSLLEVGRANTDTNKFAMIWTKASDATSEAPSISTGSSIAGELVRKRGMDHGAKHTRDHSSEGHVGEKWRERPEKAHALHLRGGTSHDDFADAVQVHSRTCPIPQVPLPPPNLEHRELIRTATLMLCKDPFSHTPHILYIPHFSPLPAYRARGH